MNKGMKGVVSAATKFFAFAACGLACAGVVRGIEGASYRGEQSQAALKRVADHLFQKNKTEVPFVNPFVPERPVEPNAGKSGASPSVRPK